MLTGKFRLSPNCFFNLDSQVIERNGQELELSDIEYRILLALVHHVNEPMTTNVLIESIWGTQMIGKKENLFNCIHRLRNHIGDRHLIMTLHGYGYMLHTKSIKTDDIKSI